MVSMAATVERVNSLRVMIIAPTAMPTSCTRATMPPGAKRMSKRKAMYAMMRKHAIAMLFNAASRS